MPRTKRSMEKAIVRTALAGASRLRNEAKLSDRQKRQVKVLIGRRQDIKFVDQNQAQAAIDAAGTILGALCTPAQGVTENQRIADNIMVKDIDITLNFQAADAVNNMRVIIFQWQENNAVNTPTIAKVFQQTAVQPTLAQLNEAYLSSGTMKVLYDKIFFGVVSNDSMNQVVRLKLFGRRLGKKKLEFVTGATTGWDNYYIAVISDSAAASHPTFGYTCRTRFSDA